MIVWVVLNSAILVAWATWLSKGIADEMESGGLQIAAIQLSIMLGGGFGGFCSIPSRSERGSSEVRCVCSPLQMLSARADACDPQPKALGSKMNQNRLVGEQTEHVVAKH